MRAVHAKSPLPFDKNIGKKLYFSDSCICQGKVIYLAWAPNSKGLNTRWLPELYLQKTKDDSPSGPGVRLDQLLVHADKSLFVVDGG